MINRSKIFEGIRHVIAVLLVFGLGSASLHAEVLIIPVVGQGWQIKFEGPVLAVESQEINAEGLTYRGNAGRLNVLARVNAQSGRGGDSKACRDYFWRQASQNPMIQQESVKQWSTPYSECVEYVTVDGGEGKGVPQANMHCYFEILGQWADVHASVVSPTEDDTRMLKTLAESLMYCTFADSKGGPQEFVMGEMGVLRFDVPAAWRVGNQCVTKGVGISEQHTLSLFSATDPGKSWKMTFFNSAVRYKTLKDIQQAAQNAQRPAAPDAVAAEGKGEGLSQEIKLKQGVGCHVEYTDAPPADKPAEAGAPKVVSSAFVAPVPDVLGMVMIFAKDAKDADFLAAIQALGTIEWTSAKAK